MKITAVLFDMDGVLVDNHAFHVQAWQQFGQHYGKQLSPDEFDQHISGRTIEAALDYFFGEEKSAAEKAQMAEEKEALYRKLYRPKLEAVKGLPFFLEELRDKKIKTAVVSSAMVKNIDMVLDALNIRAYFDKIVNGSQVVHSKPAPDIYLHAARQLQLAPASCLVFEDSKSGIEAGWNAGMPVVALATTHSRQELMAFGNAHIIPDFTAFSLEQFQQANV